ncbi:UDP-N-acetylglucosamine 1-carboxyvinyltransferase [Rhizobium sp. BK098]|nr:UDP-N-acetylglucosamine 1-carboxyvinyltransferase [Rhizobium sp. BK098]
MRKTRRPQPGRSELSGKAGLARIAYMDRIRIVGGNELNGIIPISGAKNAALPLMIASLLTSDTLTLENVPHLADVELLMRILGNHGVDVAVNGRRERQEDGYSRTIHFTCRTIVDTTAPYELVAKMRASFWVIGPLLAREGQARVSLPGGCAIGTRPVDLFIEGLQALGATMEIDGGYINATAPKGGLIGARYDFPKVSVGATHVLMMAATLARGTTVIGNAAREPEIVDLANCLIAMGAKISGAGTSTITIEGVTSLSGARHRVLPDRIETGTYAMAVAMAGGDVTLENTDVALLDTALESLRRAGATVSPTNNGIRVMRNGGGIQPVDVVTDPFPGFPTDLQAQFMALMTRSSGVSHITETIFENRFMHVQELARLGAKISLSGQTARIEGVEKLKGAPVMATDLRASVSLVIAGLAAEGETLVSRIYHLDRGFERLEDKLTRCGAVVERISD